MGANGIRLGPDGKTARLQVIRSTPCGEQRCMALRRLAPVPVLLALLALPAHASAAFSFSPCPNKPGVDCATLTVPIDRSGNVPGTFDLHVERVKGGGQGAIVALRGGPGDPATDATVKFSRRLRSALATRDLYVFDQRGTGQSGAIHCAGLEMGAPPAQAMPACAAQLGPKGNYYTTLESARDMEALRQAIGVPKLAIYGISYGTYVAQAYAGLYPQNVESLVLDSPVAPSHNADPFLLKSFQALPHVLRSICARGACRGIISGFQQRSFELLRKLASKPASGTWYDAGGKAHRQAINSLTVAAALPNLDFKPNLRAELPRATAGALHGDFAPIARLVAGAAAGTATSHPASHNPTLGQVTVCEERDHGWDRTASPADKLAQLQAEFNRVPSSAFAPFPRVVGLAVTDGTTCAYWPMLPTPPSLPTGPLPAVPALILDGEADVRTDIASAREVAARLPMARVLVVPHAGHGVLQGDDSGCALRALSEFFEGRTLHNCGRIPNPYPPRRIAPAHRPRTPAAVVQAVRLTVKDAFDQIDPGIYGYEGLRAAGGLRGGSYRVTRRGVLLRRDVFVPGVAVSGLVRRHGSVELEVAGACSGRLTFRPGGDVTGSLGGHTVRVRGALRRETVGQRLDRRRLSNGQLPN
jgi:pimeloyl-ACP methyl ester carboxylesterase